MCKLIAITLLACAVPLGALAASAKSPSTDAASPLIQIPPQRILRLTIDFHARLYLHACESIDGGRKNATKLHRSVESVDRQPNTWAVSSLGG